MNLDYALTGVMKGEYIEIYGNGNIDDVSGSYNLDLKVMHAPKGWDPAVIILICCDNLRLFSAQKKLSSSIVLAQNGLPYQLGSQVNSARKGVMVNERGDYIVSVQAKGFLFIKDGVAYSRSVILDGFSLLEQYGGIREVCTPYEETIKPTIPGHAEGISIFQVECNNGEKLFGTTTYPYIFHCSTTLNGTVVLKIESAVTNSHDYYNNKKPPQISMRIIES